jgi:phosphatidylinositol alpha-1,6-mannosyltransferase
MAGQGDDAERLKAKAAELGHAASVIFTGPIREHDLDAIYRAAHVFCLVSDKGPGRGEGIPLTPLEALASGIPIVVGDEDGSLEAVDGSRNGIVVSPRDPAAMTEALVTLLSETGQTRETRITEARAVAEERFGYAAFREKHAALYAGITSFDSIASTTRTE